jgi:hypothetical protein
MVVIEIERSVEIVEILIEFFNQVQYRMTDSKLAGPVKVTGIASAIREQPKVSSPVSKVLKLSRPTF